LHVEALLELINIIQAVILQGFLELQLQAGGYLIRRKEQGEADFISQPGGFHLCENGVDPRFVKRFLVEGVQVRSDEKIFRLIQIQGYFDGGM
jgi:hypothetical protein